MDARAPRRRAATVGIAVLLGLLVFAAVDASHSQTAPNGEVVQFTQVAGNEWWVKVRMRGPDGPSVSSVKAQDTGGPWVSLASQSWTSDHTWWAGSFHIEPGHQVRFSALFPDGTSGLESCWFDHPAGVEQCGTSAPPPGLAKEAESFAVRTAGGRQTQFAASGGAVWNLWSNGHIEDSLQGDGTGTLVVVARGTPLGGVWPTMKVFVDGAVAGTVTVSSSTLRDYPIVVLASGPHTVRIAFTNDARTSTEDRNLILDVVRVTADEAPPPPPPPPPEGTSTREAESFAVRTAGGRQTQTTASGGAVWNLWSNGHIEDNVQGDGTGMLVVVARGTPLGGVWPTMKVFVDGAVAGTLTVSSSTLVDYPIVVLASGPHTVRIAFTNDARSSTEDRNLILDVVRAGAGSASGPWTLGSDQTAAWSFQWSGGAGHFVADAASPADLNLGARLRVEIHGEVIRESLVAGPVARPAWAAFDLPAGQFVVNLTALGGTVIVSGPGVSTTPPAMSFTGAGARVHAGGSAQGSAWLFTDFGYLESRLVVQQSGWYELRVAGVGTVNDVGPLVHLWRNRTVVAEGVQGTTIDLSVRQFLVAGVGYTLGASFENPWPERTARFDMLAATPSSAPPALPPALPVEAVDNPAGWPQYGRDGYNTRSNPDPSLPTAATASALQLAWRTDVDGSVTGTPTVANGRVYFGTWNSSFYCLDEATGAEVWRTDMPERVDGSAAVVQGKVVFSNGDAIAALDAETGAALWRTTFGGHAWSSPTIDDGAVFVGLGGSRGHVARLDLATGAVLWMTPTTAIANGGARVWASPLVPPGSGLVVVGTSPGTESGQGPTIDSLLAFDRENGTLRWVHQFFPRDKNLEDTREQALLSNRDISGTPHLAFIGGRPVVLASQKHGPAWAVDLSDGSLVSGGRLLEQRTALIGSGGVADGVRVVSSAQPDRVAAFDLVTGDLLWQHNMPSTEFAPVAIANGVVWIGSWEGHLHAFDLHSGREIVRLEAGGGVFGGASLANGTVFVGALQRPANGSFHGSLGQLPGAVSAWRP